MSLRGPVPGGYRNLISGLFLLLVCASLAVPGEELVAESWTFPSKNLPPLVHFPASMQQQAKLFHASLKSMPEATIVYGGIVFGNNVFQLSQEQSSSLLSLISKAYQDIQQDPVLSKLPSSLPYCFAEEEHTTGQTFVTYPENLPKKPLCIVFLHGYGGNFLFYPYALSKAFPEALILYPSWGISWGGGSLKYLMDLLNHTEKKLGVRIESPWLMGLSAGGRGGFSIYRDTGAFFAGYISLAAAPPKSMADHFEKEMNILMINSTEDAMCPLKLAKERAGWIKQSPANFQFVEVPGNHFFLLSHPEPTFKACREYMGRVGHAR